MVRTLGTLALALVTLWPGPASACRLALLLALDVSSSVDDAEYLLQRNGLAAALTNPEVQSAFLGTGLPVAISAFEWSGRYNHQTILDWRMIRSRSDLLAASEAIASTSRSTSDFPTAIGYALGHAALLLSKGPDCERKTVDVSGDGENNEGFGPALAYRHFPLSGVTVNALAIGGSTPLNELVTYFRREVIRGPGAFVETALNYSDFEEAIRRKLEREVAMRVVGEVR